ncbi:MAG: PorV/PorQ family protein [Elusimicrobia bacterium]|nr:PorV/PorQ family protein [Elusimicrobiota bacterium]MBD3412784.1 PorV/PorQ family protein [Elusimicrobiota bacterium]
MKRVLMISCLCLGLSGLNVPVRAEKSFGLANDYLQYGAGARSLAMGGAFTGLADDASAAYWNPAALAFIDEYQLLTMYAPYRMDMHYSFASIAMPFREYGSVSFSDVMLLFQGFQERNDLNQVTGSDKSILKNSASVSYAYPLYNLIGAGVRVRFLQERVFSTSGDALGFDASLYSRPFKGISLGLSVNNINRPKITLVEAPNIYGRHTRFGLAYHARNDTVIVAVDGNKLEEQDAFYTAGVEVNPITLLSLRGGYNQHGQVTAGVGISVWPFKFDYAFSDHEELGQFNKLSVTFRWGNIYEAEIVPEGMNEKTGSIFMKGLFNELHFKTSIPAFNVAQWALVITDENKNTVRTMKGETRPPDIIVWNMQDDAGRPVKRGRYHYRFDIEYYNGKTWTVKDHFALDFNQPRSGKVDVEINGDSRMMPEEKEPEELQGQDHEIAE